MLASNTNRTASRRTGLRRALALGALVFGLASPSIAQAATGPATPTYQAASTHAPQPMPAPQAGPQAAPAHTTHAPASARAQRTPKEDLNAPRLYVGNRSGVAFIQGSTALQTGIEVGITRRGGFGGGMRLMGVGNLPKLGNTSSDFGATAMFDLRYYFKSLSYVDFYPSLSLGFAATNVDDKSFWVPVIEAGGGTRVHLDRLSGGTIPLYMAMDFGLADVVVPYATVSIGGTFGES